MLIRKKKLYRPTVLNFFGDVSGNIFYALFIYIQNVAWQERYCNYVAKLKHVWVFFYGFFTQMEEKKISIACFSFRLC